MQHIHRNEKEQFKKLFEQEKADRIDDRFKILDHFLQIEKHITVDELSDVLTESGLDLDRPFIKDTLRLMCRFGFAQKRKFEDGLVRYEHRHLGHHHDHMICTKCGKIIEFKDDALENAQIEIAARYQFHMLQHKMEIYGICADCTKDHGRQIPLTMAKAGEKLVIKEFSGGSNAKMRLLTMGLRIGDGIEVITNPNAGQMVVAMDFKRYAIGRGIAQKVIVERTGSDKI
jgi:Fur family ferric uptake transcriptional regulator